MSSLFRNECLSLCRIPWIYYVYVVLALIEYDAEALLAVGDGSSFESLCIQKCAEQNRTNSEHLNCSDNCYVNQCSAGCKLWQDALNSSCKNACNKIDQDEELYCVMGCNNAISRYFKYVSDQIGVLSAPALVADSLTATSLSLEWQIPLKLTEVTKGWAHIASYLVQWRYEEIGHDWKYCRNQSIYENSTIKVSDLRPFTKYRFRIALVFSTNHEMEMFSEPSLVISTLAQGPPLSEPKIVRAVAVDHTRISLSWESGLFPNGPILFYVLQVAESNGNGYLALKDIPAGENEYLVEKLAPKTEYKISLKMRNAYGEGPAAVTIVSTTEQPFRPEHEELKLILVSEHKILLQGSNYFYDTPNIIYNSTEAIVGVSTHVSKKLLFIADESQKIYKTHLEGSTILNREVVYEPEDLTRKPLKLSVDWLNNQLYILFEIDLSYKKIWQISRCNFHGGYLQVVYGGLQTKPYHFEVDPFNGYLFWSVKGSGLYRLDLRDVSNGVRHEISPLLIYDNFDTAAFTIDYIRFKLLLASEEKNTVFAVDLDGKKFEDFRTNTQNPQFAKVKSIAVAHDIFYWTSGIALLNEEFHKKNKNFYHNSYSDFAQIKNFLSICVMLPSAQPIPIPVNPPSNLQAILSRSRGKVSWHTPHLLGIQGRGSWQDWSYHLEITNEDNGNSRQIIRNIKSSRIIVGNLTANTNYKFRVAAYTSAGIGPFSIEFHGRTMKSVHDRSLIWSSHFGLIQSDILAEHVHILIPYETLGQQNITDIAWFEDVLYLVCNHSLYVYNRTSKHLEQFYGMDSVQKIAIDWIGRRLYWYNPAHQMISRGNLNGFEQEPLVSFSATDLKIDALRGYMYFSSSHSVEFCRLNGKQRNEYYRNEVYSGKQVMGLTLDTDNERVYWIVRSFEGSSLISAPMIGTDDEHLVGIEEFKLSEKSIQGPLMYFSDRLLWLQDNHTIVISNMTGKNLAFIKNKELNGLKAFSVIDPSHHSTPANVRELNVRPESLNASSVRVAGTYKAFTISWNPIGTINYGDIFYEVKYFNTPPLEVQEPFVHISNENGTLPPYTPITISIRAYTYWASSKAMKLQIYSPAAAPSTPTKPRTFLSHHHNPIHGGIDIAATFRWSPPENTNGPLIGYKVSCWINDGNGSHYYVLDQFYLPPNFTEKSVVNLKSNEMYHFQVFAISIAETGPATNPISVNTSKENPIPRAFVASGEEIYEIDLDLDQTTLILNTGSLVTHMTYIALDKQLIWINENNELMLFRGGLKHKLYTINATAMSITVDWLERIVYWSQFHNGHSAIYAFDLSRLQSYEVTKRNGLILNLKSAPLLRRLFWIEPFNGSEDVGAIFHFDLDENQISPLMNAHTREAILSLHNTMILETAEHETRIWLIDVNHILYSIELLSQRHVYSGMAFSSNFSNLIKDVDRLYWTRDNVVYATDFGGETSYQMLLKFTVNTLLSPTHQIYPPLGCLIPDRQFLRELRLDLIESKERSLIVKVPKARLTKNCSVQPLGIKYKIFFKPLDDDESSDCTPTTCQVIDTSDRMVEINDLMPFTKYAFQISGNNFYGEQMNVSLELGPPVVFETKTGTPSRPRNVTVHAISPTEAIVKWMRPLTLNGKCVSFEIHWQTQNAINGVQQQLSISNSNDCQSNDRKRNSQELFYSTTIQKLLPSQPYKVWVLAYTTKTTFNQSLQLEFETLPEPTKIFLVALTSHSLTVDWDPYAYADNYTMFYRRKDSPENESVEIITSENYLENKRQIEITQLAPKKTYVFWVSLKFPLRDDAYVWPSHDQFSFETNGDCPNPPGQPIVSHLRSDVFQVTWSAPVDNGAPIEEYSLEALRYRALKRTQRNTNELPTVYSTSMLTAIPLAVEETEPLADTWTEYYNGSDNYWIVKDLTPINLYSFRVRARNAYGWSEHSELSDPITETYTSGVYREVLLLAIGIPLLVTLTVMLTSCLICAFRRNTSDKKIHHELTTRSDVELATLRDLPRNGNFIQSNNILYSNHPITDAELALLPQIRREQITMSSFLGSGAFGEVYEGCVMNFGGERETRVAIKTLRKGATDQEKAEFLQEATLMSNFKHKHILRMIGVCLDFDSLYIVMELMQGGDLLSFLRQSRPLDGHASALTLNDLVSICVDIASGCRYLEEMHFVHRDLACRNCLVSSPDPANRVVKIGDFGLTRDVYKNDYYRKDGEGLMPVRWMSPESLVYGVFTSQSDVWAFGVLCWEVSTLGQQPYPARNNVEVLAYVRDGGRLNKPENCPEQLYQLMLDCWNERPECRPTFRSCLEVIQKLQSSYAEVHKNIPWSEFNVNVGGVFNRSYLLADENHNNNREFNKYQNSTCETYIQAETSNESSKAIPKYLEILFDENTDNIQNPYEIPIAHHDTVSVCSDSLPPPRDIHSDESDELRAVTNAYENAKERLLSSSSTLSEAIN